MKKLLQRWIELLDIDGDNTKQKVIDEMIQQLVILESD